MLLAAGWLAYLADEAPAWRAVGDEVRPGPVRFQAARPGLLDEVVGGGVVGVGGVAERCADPVSGKLVKDQLSRLYPLRQPAAL